MASGFWSYVHADDQADGGRVAQLARNVVSEYGLLTGESIELFLDQDALEWGNRWRGAIDESLASIAFFIPVITPRYFRSAECRRELQFFARRATALGVRELVLPLLYVDFPGLHDESPSDDLVRMIREFQWDDWTGLRFEDPSSAAYRQGVSRLANRLVAANELADRTDVVAAAEAIVPSSPEEGDEPGLLERLVGMETAMPEWSRVAERISEVITSVGELSQAATGQMEAADRRGRGFAGKLSVARQLAGDLTEPAAEIADLGNSFATHLHAVDSGIRAVIELAPAEAAGSDMARQQVCEFFGMVRNLSRSASDGLASLQGMVDSIVPVERMSRDLRPALRKMRQGLTLMTESRELTDEWVRLIAASGVVCPDEGLASTQA